MEFLKKAAVAARSHYEKLVLSVVMLALAAAVWYLYQARAEEGENLKKYITGVEQRTTKTLKPVDFTRFNRALELAKNPSKADFSLPHNLVNPVKWLKGSDGSMVKVKTGQETGPARLVATQITPLHFTVTLDRIAAPGGYWIGIAREAAERVAERRKRQFYSKLNESNAVFTLLDIKGPPEKPDELVLQLNNSDTKDRVSVTSEKPFARVDGYEADLKYLVDGKEIKNQREGATVRFGDEDYKIVAVRENEVVLSHPNGKQYRVRLAPSQ